MEAEEVRHGALQVLGLEGVVGVVDHQEPRATHNVGVGRVLGEEQAVQHAGNRTLRGKFCWGWWVGGEWGGGCLRAVETHATTTKNQTYRCPTESSRRD